MNEIINNMGGFSKAELVYSDEIKKWSETSSGVRIESVKERHLLNTVMRGIKLSAVPKMSKNGTIYEHKCAITLKNDLKMRSELSGIGSRGFIILATDLNNQAWVYGHPENPLFGTLEQITGNKATDLHSWQLTATGSSLTPEQPLL